MSVYEQTPDGPGSPAHRADSLTTLYALSRLSDVLLLSFQPEADPAWDTPWEHWLDLVGTDWPAITREQYLELFTALGMSPITDLRFDPLLHEIVEIVEVDQADDADAPITVSDPVWPGLMLGQMVFARAGVKVRAGVNHAQRGIADRSPLYWTFLRRHRPAIDLSGAWGRYSEWDTDFRRDYRADHVQHLNVDVTGDVEADDPRDGDLPPLLTRSERRDLVRHRCLLRTPDNRAALEATDPHWGTNLWPFYWALTVSLPGNHAGLGGHSYPSSRANSAEPPQISA
ncbi:hypothetical protein [Catenulispora rubra]|uniref:hypothetical protein n=1 Tax=Catenulispora rubra TaxID=280293 RepID=UPI0018927F93|nr:hypothetical protein [Catenulispora rubra]